MILNLYDHKKKKEKKKLDSSEDEAEKSEKKSEKKKRKVDDDDEDEETKELSDGLNLKKAKVVEDENPNSLSKFRISEVVKAKLKLRGLRLAVVSMAGLAAEGLKYDKVVGQSVDLFSLQRFINRSKPPIGKEQQQNLTRWANNATTHEALMAAMSKKASVLECIKAIESAS
ncbi:uncharacterized protein A4U43_C02F15530 [Asparagus officinalis]|uniref:Uncharacterized protein n=1 Tax=Asparagus officinalis TaxID=4686 RepID=A0A5P1FIH5_ASPOF|nr:uncharacterized protein A4U43_C02F15530 [Asparagus officinalis]